MFRALSSLLFALSLAPGVVLAATPSESQFREALGVKEGLRLAYRSADCQAITFEEFSVSMQQGAKLDMERSADGKDMTVSLRAPGKAACASPYPPVAEMPPLDLPDLAGRRVTAASLRGKPTLVNFYFATCKPCILEVGPLNEFAKSRPDLNALAITFDEPGVAREFVKRFGFRWRIVPDARDFIDRMQVKHYPMLALFDADGRLLGVKSGGARDEFEARAVGPQVRRWVDSLLRAREGGSQPAGASRVPR